LSPRSPSLALPKALNRLVILSGDWRVCAPIAVEGACGCSHVTSIPHLVLRKAVQTWSDDEGLDGTAPALELEAQAIHHAASRGDHIVAIGIVGLQIEVVGAGDSRLIQDGKLEILTESDRQVIGGGIGALRFPSAMPPPS